MQGRERRGKSFKKTGGVTVIWLSERVKKRYNHVVPICPRCSATIHTGADDQCPACGYSLLRAKEIFGDRQVEFTRVLDEAGALTHQERMELMHLLENLERNLPPIGLCIYLTDNGQVQHVRTHAHWILNQARIHHPSFGKREQRKAIEDAELRERHPGDTSEPFPHQEQGFLSTLWGNIKERWRDTFHPYPPPVRQEWMLILVMDVQLETACFSWGYMLDSYINPDSINSCIISARLQFRERAMVTGLKKVMRSVVHNIALEAHSVNRRIRRNLMTSAAGATPLLLVGAAALALAEQSSAQETEQTLPSAPVELLQDDTAEEVVPSAAPASPPEKVPAQETGKPVPAQSPEGGTDIPRWQEEHYRLLMAGELATGYISLFPAPPEEKSEADRKEKKTEKKSSERKPKPARRSKGVEESDTTVPVRYHAAYTQESLSGLIDPQGLLSTMERNDVLYALNELNVRSNFQIYVSLFKGTQQIPTDMTTSSLLTAAAQRSDYAVMLRYPLEAPAAIEIAYKGMPEDQLSRQQWLEQVRAAAASDGEGGVCGIFAAIRCLSESISPIARHFRTTSTSHDIRLPAEIKIEYRPEESKEDDSFKKKIADMVADPINLPYFVTLGVALFVAILTFSYYFFVRRRGAILLETQPDLRLSSPYGAGVSRYVRYLEGKEASKAKRLF